MANTNFLSFFIFYLLLFFSYFEAVFSFSFIFENIFIWVIDEHSYLKLLMFFYLYLRLCIYSYVCIFFIILLPFSKKNFLSNSINNTTFWRVISFGWTLKEGKKKQKEKNPTATADWFWLVIGSVVDAGWWWVFLFVLLVFAAWSLQNYHIAMYPLSEDFFNRNSSILSVCPFVVAIIVWSLYYYREH